jgi:GDP-fucose transporter C1
MSSQKPQRGLVAAVVLFYIFAALSMVMANKWVLNTTKAPLFFLFTQLFIAVLLFLASGALSLLPERLTLDPKICKALTLNVTLSVVGLSFSNYTLKYVDASFYQVARGMVLPFTIFTSYIFLSHRPSALILLSSFIVTLGFFIGVFMDGTPISLTGISFGVVSSAITASHSIVIKKSLNAVGGSALLLSWYSNFMGACVMLPVSILAGEMPAIMEILTGETSGDFTTFAWGSLITGTLGFAMSIATLLSIKTTSPITHMVSSAVRGVAASLLGMWLFKDVITTGRATSIATILLGSIYYTYVKNEESKAGNPDSRSPPPAYSKLELEQMEDGVVGKERKDQD